MPKAPPDLKQRCKEAKEACQAMARARSSVKNQALEALSANLEKFSEEILVSNERDIHEAKATGLDTALIDRLSLVGRLDGIIQDTKNLIAIPDPIGKIIESRTLENGLKLTKKRTPIGVLGVIYESRPNVTVDISALTIKTGNCAVLRGGSETLHTNLALMKAIHQSLKDAGLPIEAIQFIDNPDRNLVTQLLQQHSYVDMIIPRGGAALHQYCRDHSKIPVITGGIGICHLFVDSSADLSRSLEVVDNAKTQRPTVCNALDTLLVHTDVGAGFIPDVVRRLGDKGVKFRMDPPSLNLMNNENKKHRDLCLQAKDKDWDTEWLSLVLNVKVVKDCAEAIGHVQKHSSGHSDGILTQDAENARLFTNEVDSSSVYVNASTRFTDGSQFGLGAEVAISTQKLHARGPMGPEELTSYKWIVEGDYTVRR